jgi:hypothetical protein
MAAPTREKVRRDKEEPMLIKSSTDKEDPRRESP